MVPDQNLVCNTHWVPRNEPSKRWSLPPKASWSKQQNCGRIACAGSLLLQDDPKSGGSSCEHSTPNPSLPVFHGGEKGSAMGSVKGKQRWFRNVPADLGHPLHCPLCSPGSTLRPDAFLQDAGAIPFSWVPAPCDRTGTCPVWRFRTQDPGAGQPGCSFPPWCWEPAEPGYFASLPLGESLSDQEGAVASPRAGESESERAKEEGWAASALSPPVEWRGQGCAPPFQLQREGFSPWRAGAPGRPVGVVREFGFWSSCRVPCERVTWSFSRAPPPPPPTTHNQGLFWMGQPTMAQATFPFLKIQFVKGREKTLVNQRSGGTINPQHGGLSPRQLRYFKWQIHCIISP